MDEFLTALNIDTKSDFVSHYQNTFHEIYSPITNSAYYRELDLVSHPNIDSNDYIFLSLNIRSLSTKFIELGNLVDNLSANNKNVSVVALQELDKNPSSSFYMPGFLSFSKIRNRNGGGVGFYVRNNLNPEEITGMPFIDGIFESIALKITIKNRKAILFNFYRPPLAPNLSFNESINRFHSEFHLALERLKKLNLPIFLCGDSNINLLTLGNNKDADLLYSNLMEFGLNLCTHKATHLNPINNSLIDLIAITRNFFNPKSSGVIIDGLSDHFINFLTFSCANFNHNHTSFKTRIFSEEALNSFKTNLSHFSWENVYNSEDPNLAADHFFNDFHFLFNSHFPEKVIKPSKKYNKINNWMTRGLLKSREVKLKLSRKVKLNPSDQNLRKFRNYRNLYNILIKKAKKLFFSDQLKQSEKDPKRLWQTINQITGKTNCNNSSISEILHNGEIISDEKSICNAFNEYFTSIGASFCSDSFPTNKHFSDFLPPPSQSSFFFQPTTHLDIMKTLNELKSKQSRDIHDISVKLLKEVSEFICHPLSYIFNLSVSNGIFPSFMKKSKTIVLHKKGDKTCLENYRGISLVSSFSKIFEKIVAKQLITYLENINFFYDLQFGFRKSHSTFHALLAFLNDVSTALNDEDIALVTWIDVSKAFDSVNHEILFKKLQNYGIRGVALDFFRDYFQDRVQNVKIGNSWSDNNCTIEHGVLQGSILGVLLYLIYTNDLQYATNKGKGFLFADDLSSLFRAKNYEALFEKTNLALGELMDWYHSNRLAIHPSKSKYMIFRPRHLQPEIESYHPIYLNFNKTNETDLSKVKLIQAVPNAEEPAFKFLGFWMDNKLSFDFHVKSITCKINSSIYCLKISRDYLEPEYLLMLYYAYVHSHLSYFSIFQPMISQANNTALEILQRRALRTVFSLPFSEDTDFIFQSLRLLKLRDLSSFNIGKFMYCYNRNITPKAFSETWLERGRMRPNNLRNNENYDIPFPRFASFEKHPFISFPKVWNNLPYNIKNAQSLNIFKKQLNNIFLSEY